MRTIQTNVHTYSELDEKAKERVLEQFYGINVDYGWWDFIFDDAEEIGLKITEFDTYRHTIKGHLTECSVDVAKSILKQHGKNTDTYNLAESFLAELKNYIKTEFDKRDDIDLERQELVEEYEEQEEPEFTRALLEEYLSILQKEYDYLTSEEAIIETINANEYEFTKSGEFFT
jgi:hypothetical protein